MIPEALLTMEWEGLDEIYTLPDALSSEGARRLQGFIAAGGAVYNCKTDSVL